MGAVVGATAAEQVAVEAGDSRGVGRDDHDAVHRRVQVRAVDDDVRGAVGDLGHVREPQVQRLDICDLHGEIGAV